MRQKNAAGFVEADGNIEFLAFFPQRIVIRIAPHLAVDMIRPHQNAAKAELLDDAARFFDRRRHVVRRDDAGAVHAVGSDFAEIVHPIVVGFGDGGGQFRIEPVDGEHEQAAARIENRHVESFFVHGAHLRHVVEVARFFLGIFFVEYSFADRS